MLKNITINKINRKYAKITISNGFECKLIVDDAVKRLGTGTFDLDIKDVSIKTKYGTNCIYELVSNGEINENNIVFLKSDYYNQNLVNECHKLGGRYDSTTKVWDFPSYIEDKVEELDYIYNSPLKPYQITVNYKFYEYNQPIEIMGFTIATAYDRDGGAKVNNDEMLRISVLQGGFTSGGSHKNWKTVAKEGTIIRLYLPSKLVEEFGNFDDDVYKIEEV